MSGSRGLSTRSWMRRLRLLGCVALLATSSFAVSAIPRQPAAEAFSIGNPACGKVTVSPARQISGGTPLTMSVHWTGSPASSGCPVSKTNCGSVYFGSCDAGYWLVAVFCSTLAASNLANAQSYCDLNNVIVLTDYNSGPNSPSDYHGTSYNQCSTVEILGDIFGGLPGTLYCNTDGDHGNGWADQWGRGQARGKAVGPAEETGSSTPFSPAAAGIECPPSAANIAAGAIPDTCALVVMPINFKYTCFGGCVPDPTLPNNGVTENPNDFLAVTFKYAKQ